VISNCTFLVERQGASCSEEQEQLVDFFVHEAIAPLRRTNDVEYVRRTDVSIPRIIIKINYAEDGTCPQQAAAEARQIFCSSMRYKGIPTTT